MSDLKAWADEEVQTEAWRTPLGFGFARIDYGRQTGTVIKVAIPEISWDGEDAGILAAAIRLLTERKAAADYRKKSEISTPLSGETADKLYTALEKERPDHPQTAVLKALRTAAEHDGYHAAEDPSKPRFKLIALFEDEKCESVEAVYMKLLALSYGHVKPHGLNLDGIFGILPNLAWSGNTPYELAYLRAQKAALDMSGTYPHITAVDKIPFFLHHVIPADNTRILDTSKVRLGAHLAAGTTLMPGASYINFNAGTLGPAMVEGRISSSATIGPGTDVGGGASLLGVLSGGNTEPITIGANCLLGANSVTGIPLGDGCIVDAGIAVLAGSKVRITEDQIEALNAVNDKKLTANGETSLLKARDFSGMNGVHFRLDTTTGHLIAFRSIHKIKLNEALH